MSRSMTAVHAWPALEGLRDRKLTCAAYADGSVPSGRRQKPRPEDTDARLESREGSFVKKVVPRMISPFV